MKANVHPEGEFDFVVTNDGQILLGRKHTFMSGGQDVHAAGKVKLRNGEIVRIDNDSGHYKPNLQESNSFLSIFRTLGVDIKKATFRVYNSNGALINEVKPR